jgi:dipeptidyl aminopeptidase/acylaminoacyl peptidase
MLASPDPKRRVIPLRRRLRGALRQRSRLVLLPEEDHGYRARENIEHVLWEQLRWFDAYVKRQTRG